MHPLGCFGSSLAFDAKSTTCAGCTAKDECQAIVAKRRPTLMQLLWKFYDGKGDAMALQYLTPAEKKARRQAAKEAEQREAALGLMGDADAFDDIRKQLDKRSHGLLDKIIRRRVNPRSDNIELIGINPALRELVAALRAKPRSMRELTDTLTARLGQSQASAQRTAYALVSILTVCDRARRVGPLVELK